MLPCPYPDKIASRRAYLAFVLCLAACSALAVRLWSLAVYTEPIEQALAGQYTRRAEVASHTGFIFDRDGALLSHTQNGSVALVNPDAIGDKSAALEYLLPHTALSSDTLIEKLSSSEPFSITLADSPAEKPPRGIYVYPRYEESLGSFCRHLIGYRDADGRGQCGLYKKYASLLERKSTLSYRYEADTAGNILSADTFAVHNNGYTDSFGLVTTIDSALQSALEQVCDESMEMGAAVVCSLDGAAGYRVAALVSRPAYQADAVGDVLSSDEGELVNRAFSLYTPGSVFKTVTVAAALEKDASYADFVCTCTGSITVGGKVFRCHRHSGHGEQSMETAYANSCNVYFITLAEEIGLDCIADMAQTLGMGQTHALGGLYIPASHIPDRAMRESPAYTANISIGQGDLLITPLELASVYAAAVTGIERDLTLVSGFYENGTYTNFSDSRPRRVLSERTVAKLRSMMRACVRFGTGTKAQTADLEIGGKTATAQSGQYKDGSEVIHRTFVGVYPLNDPKYVVVILCDGNGNNAAPTTIFSEYVSAVCG